MSMGLWFGRSKAFVYYYPAAEQIVHMQRVSKYLVLPLWDNEESYSASVCPCLNNVDFFVINIITITFSFLVLFSF